jgi:hypothetical protein
MTATQALIRFFAAGRLCSEHVHSTLGASRSAWLVLRHENATQYTAAASEYRNCMQWLCQSLNIKHPVSRADGGNCWTFSPQSRSSFVRNFKLGHCDFQTRPLRVELGQYPPAVNPAGQCPMPRNAVHNPQQHLDTRPGSMISYRAAAGVPQSLPVSLPNRSATALHRCPDSSASTIAAVATPILVRVIKLPMLPC